MMITPSMEKIKIEGRVKPIKKMSVWRGANSKRVLSFGARLNASGGCKTEDKAWLGEI